MILATRSQYTDRRRNADVTLPFWAVWVSVNAALHPGHHRRIDGSCLSHNDKLVVESSQACGIATASRYLLSARLCHSDESRPLNV